MIKINNWRRLKRPQKLDALIDLEFTYDQSRTIIRELRKYDEIEIRNFLIVNDLESGSIIFIRNKRRKVIINEEKLDKFLGIDRIDFNDPDFRPFTNKKVIYKDGFEDRELTIKEKEEKARRRVALREIRKEIIRVMEEGIINWIYIRNDGSKENALEKLRKEGHKIVKQRNRIKISW